MIDQINLNSKGFAEILFCKIFFMFVFIFSILYDIILIANGSDGHGKNNKSFK